MTYSKARNNLKAVFDEVNKKRIPIRISRRNNEDVVILAQEEYAALEETAHLLNSPANTKHLLQSLHEATKGQTKKFTSTQELAKHVGITPNQ